MGALLANVVLIGCEPEIIDCDDTGNIGLSETVAAALEPAVRRIQGIIQQFPLQQSNKRTEEVNA
jgi:Ni,Fe-hydrogenase maturation factor